MSTAQIIADNSLKTFKIEATKQGFTGPDLLSFGPAKPSWVAFRLEEKTLDLYIQGHGNLLFCAEGRLSKEQLIPFVKAAIKAGIHKYGTMKWNGGEALLIKRSIFSYLDKSQLMNANVFFVVSVKKGQSFLPRSLWIAAAAAASAHRRAFLAFFKSMVFLSHRCGDLNARMVQQKKCAAAVALHNTRTTSAAKETADANLVNELMKMGSTLKKLGLIR